MKNVAIDWSLYKGEDNGRGKKGYISFTNCLNENGWTLKSDYTSTSEKVLLECKNGHTQLIKPNTLLNKKHKDCKECRKALKNKVEKPKVVKSNKGISSIDRKLTKRQLEHFQRIDEASIDSKLTPKQLEHFESVDKEFEYKPRRKVATDIKIESNKDFFEIDDSTRFPKNYNVTLGIPMKSVDLKEKLRKSRLLGQISRMDDLLELSVLEKE
ncbi:hypothetical protein [Clostridium perfringens]|uniref:hypothetical protein n=1 Tax=Clostridium perfringens TaxID=1502 RepID=UPI000D70B09B|nr:hypothetical protein [Clostridium perfringens]PWW86408.1 hypothetical protein CYK81_09110 [Clostridium perfringens]